MLFLIKELLIVNFIIMEKIDVLKLVMAEMGITPQQFVKHLIATGEIDLEHLSAEKSADEVELIPLTKDNLSKVKPGMFWYEDDTVSTDLSKEKKLKSVVLLVQDNIVYGDSFDAFATLGWRGAIRYAQSYYNDYIVEGQAQSFDIECFGYFGLVVKMVNESLRIIGQPEWCGQYWSCSQRSTTLGWSWRVGSGSADFRYKNHLYSVRPVFVFEVK